MRSRVFDVCVVGGGPAGCAIAMRLNTLGLKVCLLERNIEPCRRLGESIARPVLAILDTLGVRDRLESANCMKRAGSVVDWAGKRHISTQDDPLAAFHTDRARFDQTLRDAVFEAGVDVRMPAVIVQSKRLKSGEWSLIIRHGVEQARVDCCYVVAATGRRSQFAARTERMSPKTLALFAYWSTETRACYGTRIIADKNSWIWSASLPDGTTNLAVFSDPWNPVIKRASSLKAAYLELLQGLNREDGNIDGTLCTKVFACDASILSKEPPISDGFIRVGDAAFSVDPLSAQGVIFAMSSALRGAAVINTMLARPKDKDIAETFYRERQSRILQHAQNVAGGYYREQAVLHPTTFWRRRAALKETAARPEATRSPIPLSPSSIVKLCNQAKFQKVPLLAGNFVELSPALHHPSLDEPFAFYHSVSLKDLVWVLKSNISVQEIIQIWRQRLKESDAIALLQMLYTRGVVVNTGAPEHRQR